jgi:type IV secretory pathway TrbD component
MREIPPQFCVDFRRSGTKPVLLMGCEPTALMLIILISVFVFFAFQSKIYGGLFAAAFFFLCRFGLQSLAQKDPMYIRVYLRALRYKRGFWTAKPSPYGVDRIKKGGF